MPTIEVKNMEGKKVGEVELNESIFAIEPNITCVHAVVRAHLANIRRGTQSALTRAEVRGGGIKPWKQKGTGRARQGSTRSPQWKHGGVVFAPKPRDYTIVINKKVRRLAMRSVLSAKLADGELIIVDKIELTEAKTREMAKIVNALEATDALIVLGEGTQSVAQAARNLPGVKTLPAATINVYDILTHNKLVLTGDALATVQEVYGK